MAPFMEIGIKIRKLLHLPGLHIAAEQSKCISCGQCSKNCPMSLEVAEQVRKGTTDNYDCILCGVCVDTCPKKVLQYRFSKSEKK
jgi:NAD-dependent dihydropyrimidine dehydrogenase PreA subunit